MCTRSRRQEAERAAMAAQRTDTPRPPSATPRPPSATPRPPSATPRPPGGAAPSPPRSQLIGAAESERAAGGDPGPFNFRQLLRPAGHAPTESLRLKKGWQRPEVNRYGAEYDM